MCLRQKSSRNSSSSIFTKKAGMDHEIARNGSKTNKMNNSKKMTFKIYC